MPFMAITSTAYAVLLLVKEKNEKLYYVLVAICAVFGVFLVSEKGVGGYYKYIVLLMIPVMAVGNEYRRFESKNIKIPILFIMAVMLLLCVNGEIELSKGIIYGKIAFYPVTLLGILFCLQLKDILLRTNTISNLIKWLGRNSMFIMGYHFIVFKLIDVAVASIHETRAEQLQLFPYSFPSCRLLYILGGLLLPCALGCAVVRTKDYIKIKVRD